MTTTPEGLDLAALSTWFAAHIAEAGDAPLSASLIAGGRSNLTYHVTDGAHDWVVRRPPLGHVVATAHDMGREHRVMSALQGSDVPVPVTRAFCADPEVIGAPFYVMDRVDGRVVRSTAELAAFDPADALAVSHGLIDVLARLHATDYEAVGLGDFGRPDGFLARNVARWGKQWEANKTRELPQIDELARRIAAALPESGPPGIVHGDYRLENTMLANDGPEIVAVLDWEMSTLGDPLTDLGLFLVYWVHWDAGASDGVPLATGGASGLPGFIGMDEVAARYAEITGRDLSHLDFYVVFAFYKLAIILEGINARFLMGKTLGEGFDRMGQMVSTLCDAALDLATRSQIPALHG
ncbi:MAG: phosphotransferase family protein [Actinobacteria bacterium]|nr:phosphotransferase family protein [Actinomycetota bacterium]